MAAKKLNQEERLDSASMERAIKILEDKGTKKSACAALNISYNTARLDKLIEQYLIKKEEDSKRRADKRGKPATESEITFAITEYLEGRTVDSISESLFRGTSFVKSILENHGVPIRNPSKDYFKPALIPDAAVRQRFAVGEKVYSARYDTLAIIRNELTCKDGYAYGIYLPADDQAQYAYQPAWELASLQGLRDIGINI